MSVERPISHGRPARPPIEQFYPPLRENPVKQIASGIVAKVKQLTPEARTREEYNRRVWNNEDRFLSDALINDLTTHSSGCCYTEISYLLGTSGRDPHPNHEVTFTAQAHDLHRVMAGEEVSGLVQLSFFEDPQKTTRFR